MRAHRPRETTLRADVSCGDGTTVTSQNVKARRFAATHCRLCGSPQKATGVVTVATARGETKENTTAGEADCTDNMRSFDPAVRRRALAAIDRILRGEAIASGAPATAGGADIVLRRRQRGQVLIRSPRPSASTSDENRSRWNPEPGGLDLRS